MKRRCGICLLLAGLACAASASAYEASTTHAGITENAAYASRLSRILSETLGLSLGLYEPLKLPFTGAWGERLGDALVKLDAAQGYAPGWGPAGLLPAVEWLIAGSVVEEVPAARAANHFFDPLTQRGVAQGGYLDGVGLRMDALKAGTATVRDVMTGAAFSGSGEASIKWMNSPLNDRGLACFLENRERAVSAPTRDARSAALAQALLCAGALLHLIEDAAEPALVRGDDRVEFGQLGGPYRRYVAENFGRLGIPKADGKPTTVAHLIDLISNQAATGLADRTAKRFFSSGTLPGSPSAGARATQVKASPARAGYISADGLAHLARWQRNRANEVIWTLDDNCYADYAAVLIPEATLAALSAIEHLFRGELRLRDGNIVLGGIGLSRGRLTIFTEDAAGTRTPAGQHNLENIRAGETLLDAATLPAGKRVAAVLSGVDENNEPIVISVVGSNP